MKITNLLFGRSVESILSAFAKAITQLEGFIVKANAQINEIDELVQSILRTKEERQAEVDRALRVLKKLKGILD